MTLSIGSKILLGFGLVTALSLAGAGYGLMKLDEVHEITARIADRDAETLETLNRITLAWDNVKLNREKVVLEFLQQKEAASAAASSSPASVERWRRAVSQTDGLLKDLEAKMSEFARTAKTRDRSALWSKLALAAQKAREALEETRAAREAEFELARGGSLAAQRSDEADRHRQALEASMEEARQLAHDVVDLGHRTATTSYEESQTLMLAAMGVLLALAVAASVTIQRSITTPLGIFMQFVDRVGAGDLTQRSALASTNGDELGRLGENLNRMVAGLRDVAGQTRSVTENLNSASAEILASTQQQAASTSEQAAAVQQTTATMEEVRQSGTQISERAKQVAAAAESTSTASASGLHAVQGVTRTMEGIREQAETVAANIVSLSEKTQAVGEIITTVNDIAEQTHLLALNAAIESAAAGESGRSFSVVAAEMKNLADQAKEATVQVRSILSEIQNGINTSVMLTEEAVKRVEAGKRETDVAEQTIRQMTGSIQESIQTFQQIVGATNQQQIGFEQVTQALQNIRQATEQTASGTRQLEKAAASLNALSQQLLKSVERYQT